MNQKTLKLFVAAACSLFTAAGIASAQTAFTYQGRLQTNASPANGNYDMQFSLWNAATGGTQAGSTVTDLAVPVTNGLFVVTNDFGSQFNGTTYWLQIAARSNGVGSYVTLAQRQEITPTPYAIYAETGNAAGLTGIIPAGDLNGTYGNAVINGANITGTVPAAHLPGDIAYLDAPIQTFTGSNLIYTTTGAISTNLFTGLSLQYSEPWGEGASMSCYNNGVGFLSYYTKSGGGPLAKQMQLDFYGVLDVDNQNANNGILNNQTLSGAGLIFGTAASAPGSPTGYAGSGEGIASKRTAGGNQYGLDFYTAFTPRMFIGNNGFVGINRSSTLDGNDWFDVRGPASLSNNWVGMWMETANSTGAPFYGYAMNGGYQCYTWFDGFSGGNNSWNVYNGGGDLTLMPNGFLGVNTTPSYALEVNGEFAVVDGLGYARPYMGDDGVGNDVQFGSLTSGIHAFACYNAADNAYMHVYCSSITIEGGADLAEPFKVTKPLNETKIVPGSVVVIDDNNPGQLKMSDQAYDSHVAGVVSGANGVNTGIEMVQKDALGDGQNIALTGRVYVQVDASYGAVKPGDLLTTSPTPGHAMKVTDHIKGQGAILGKAMTGLKDGQGMVLVLVTLQ